MRSPFVQSVARILDVPIIYNLFQNAIGSIRFRNEHLIGLLKENNSSNLIDIGCGTASYLKVLTNFESYHGVDVSQEYLDKAKKSFSSIDRLNGNVKFSRANVGNKGWAQDLELKSNFLALGMGILHHLDDESVQNLLTELFFGATPNFGTFHSIDPVIDENTSLFARWMAENDRGAFVREPKFYQDLCSLMGLEMNYRIIRKGFRVPLDLIKMEFRIAS
jgi:hypothetical protein